MELLATYPVQSSFSSGVTKVYMVRMEAYPI